MNVRQWVMVQIVHGPGMRAPRQKSCQFVLPEGQTKHKLFMTKEEKLTVFSSVITGTQE